MRVKKLHPLTKMARGCNQEEEKIGCCRGALHTLSLQDLFSIDKIAWDMHCFATAARHPPDTIVVRQVRMAALRTGVIG